MGRRALLWTILIAAALGAMPLTWGSRAATVLLVIAGLSALGLVIDFVVTRRRRRSRPTTYALGMSGPGTNPAPHVFVQSINAQPHSITAHTVNQTINQAVTPTAVGREVQKNQTQGDGAFLTQYELTIAPPMTVVPRIEITARAPSIRSALLHRKPTGGITMDTAQDQLDGSGPGIATYGRANASGTYLLDIVTANPEPNIDVNVQLY